MTSRWARSVVASALLNIIAEVNESGQRRKRHVYGSGGEIGRETYQTYSQQYVAGLVFRNPITGDSTDGTTDPLGGLMPPEDAYATNPNPDYFGMLGDRDSHSADADPFEPSGGCTVDGIPRNCDEVMGGLNNGSVVVQITAGGKRIQAPVRHVGTGGWVYLASDPRYTNFRYINGVLTSGVSDVYPWQYVGGLDEGTTRVAGERYQKRIVALAARGKDENAFLNRAKLCGGDVRQFASGQELINGMKSLSATGAIDMISIHSHGTDNGLFIEGLGNYIGLYIGNPSHPTYNSTHYNNQGQPFTISFNDIFGRGNRGQASAEELADAIVAGSIDIAQNGEITFFGCNSDALASHLAFILNAKNRGDINVTGASGSVDELNKYTARVDRGWFNTYQGGRFKFNSGRRRSYR